MPTPRSASQRRLACCAAAAAVLALTSCSGTVEASYRPPPPVVPTTTVPVPTVAPVPTPTVAPTVTASPATGAACGPDQVEVEFGELESSQSNRAVPLLLHSRVPETLCGVSNPIGVELVDATGKTLPSRVDAGVLPKGRTALDAIPTQAGATVRIEWRAAPTSPSVDPDKSCVRAKGMRLTLAQGAPPIAVPATLTACDGGALVVGPAEVIRD
jgi:hypothetical protein